jgi:hypothetical protein
LLLLFLAFGVSLACGAVPEWVYGVRLQGSQDEPYFGRGTRTSTSVSATTEGTRLRLRSDGGASFEFVIYQNAEKLAPGTYEVSTEDFGPSILRMDWIRPTADTYNNAVGGVRGQLEVLEYDITGSGQPFTLWCVLKLTDQFKTAAGSQPTTLIIDFRYRVEAGHLVNAKPLVYAGGDRSQTLRETTILRGAALDPVNSSLDLQWSKVDGPGDVIFTTPFGPATTAKFSQPGTYTLRLTGSIGTQTVTDDIVIERLSVETSAIIRPFNSGVTRAQLGQDFAYEPDQYAFTTELAGEGTSLTFNVGSIANLYIRGWDDGTFRPLTAGTYGAIAPDGNMPTATLSFNGGMYITQNFVIHELEADSLGKLIKFHGQLQFAEGNANGLNIASFRLNASRTSTELPNAAPALEVGPPRVVPLTDIYGQNSLTLRALLNDDDQPVNVCPGIEWEQIDGPSFVQFSSTHDSRPVVQGIVPGIYHFRATASDGSLSVNRDCTVIVKDQTRHFNGLLTIEEVPLGKFSIMVTRNGRFTGKVMYRGDEIPMAGWFAGGYWSQSWRTRSGDTVTLKLTLATDQTRVIGDLVTPGVDFHFEAKQPSRDILAALGQTSEFAGSHVLALRTVPTTDVPNGYGPGTMRITPDGRFRILASLPDGTKISRGGMVQADHKIPLMQTLYAGRGSFGAELLLDAQSLPDRTIIGARAAWFHPPSRQRLDSRSNLPILRRSRGQAISRRELVKMRSPMKNTRCTPNCSSPRRSGSIHFWWMWSSTLIKPFV